MGVGSGLSMYDAPAWHGFCSTADCVRLESFLRRCAKLGYVDRSATVRPTVIFLEADDALFQAFPTFKTLFNTSLPG